jgi:hypothetical protein
MDIKYGRLHDDGSRRYNATAFPARTCIQRAPLSYFAHFHRDKGPRAVVRDLPRKARSSPQPLKKVSFFLQYCNFIPPVLQTYRIFIRLSVNSIKY